MAIHYCYYIENCACDIVVDFFFCFDNKTLNLMGIYLTIWKQKNKTHTHTYKEETKKRKKNIIIRT